MRLYRRWKEFTETQRTTHETSLSYEREGEATAWADVPDISRRSNDDPNPKGRGKGKGKGKNKGKDEGLLEVKGKSTDQLAKSACAFGQPELVRNQELPVEACKGRGEPRQHLSRVPGGVARYCESNNSSINPDNKPYSPYKLSRTLAMYVVYTC